MAKTNHTGSNQLAEQAVSEILETLATIQAIAMAGHQMLLKDEDTEASSETRLFGHINELAGAAQAMAIRAGMLAS